MFRSMKYSQIAKSIIGKLTEEIIKLLRKDKSPDFYFSLEGTIKEAMTAAYEEGVKDGRDQVTYEVMKFDTEKDMIGN